MIVYCEIIMMFSYEFNRVDRLTIEKKRERIEDSLHFYSQKGNKIKIEKKNKQLTFVILVLKIRLFRRG